MMIRSESIILESAQWLKLLRWAEQKSPTHSTHTFLNAVAKTDSFHRLYNTQMQDDLNGGIIRSGSNQNDFQYSLKQGMADKPVNFVNIFDVMRFCNWLHNGAHRSSDTESGAYRLHREMDENNLSKIVRNPSARVFIPTEDEWHKAAFFESEPVGKPSQTYWKFATASDDLTSDSAVWGTTGLQSVGVDWQVPTIPTISLAI